MPEASLTGQKTTMKAIVCNQYGSPDVLRLEEVDKPVVNDDDVLVRVKAASVNPADRFAVRGGFVIRLLGGGLRGPKRKIPGADLSGTVEGVGRNVTKFHPADEVFGTGRGSFAEYASAREDKLAIKPTNITFEQAAAIPIAGITALQALRDWGKVQPEQKVLINGASGGVGSFAVQIANSFGAEVTGVCSTRNVDQARSLGADRVIDYTREDFVRGGELYNLMLDNAGNRSLSDCRRVLVSNGILIMNAAPRGNFVGFLGRLLTGLLLSRFTSKKAVFQIAKINAKDRGVMRELIEAGKVTPVIDRSYPLSEAPDAFRYLEKGHARAKIVIAV